MKIMLLTPALFVLFVMVTIPAMAQEDDYVVGEVHWIEKHYFTSGYFVIRVLDSDMNQNSNKIEKFKIAISSDSDPDGISPSVYETGKNTGVFESNIYVSEKPFVGQRLHVLKDDVIIAEYKDQTLPLASADDELKILDSFMVDKTFMDSDKNQGFIRIDDPSFVRQNLQTGETMSPIGTLASIIIGSLGPIFIVFFIVIYAAKKRNAKKALQRKNEN